LAWAPRMESPPTAAARAHLPPGVDDGAPAVAHNVVVPAAGWVGGVVWLMVGECLPLKPLHRSPLSPFTPVRPQTLSHSTAQHSAAQRSAQSAQSAQSASPPSHAPAPRLRVDRLPHAPQDAQAVAVVLLHVEVPRAHEGTDGGGGGVELPHLLGGGGGGGGGGGVCLNMFCLFRGGWLVQGSQTEVADLETCPLAPPPAHHSKPTTPKRQKAPRPHHPRCTCPPPASTGRPRGTSAPPQTRSGSPPPAGGRTSGTSAP